MDRENTTQHVAALLADQLSGRAAQGCWGLPRTDGSLPRCQELASEMRSMRRE